MPSTVDVSVDVSIGGKGVVTTGVAVDVVDKSTPQILQDFLQFSDIQASESRHCPIKAQPSHMVSLV